MLRNLFSKESKKCVLVVAMLLIPGAKALETSIGKVYADFGVGFGTYSYIEPKVMDITSTPILLNASLTREGERIFHKIYADVSYGIGGRYNGGLMELSSGKSTAFKTDSSDIFYNLSYVAGWRFKGTQSYKHRIYLGIGHRYLINNLKGPGSYTREQTYLYMPLGYEGEYFFNAYTSLIFGIGFNAVIQGHNISHVSKNGFLRDAKFYQEGFGNSLYLGMKYDLKKYYVFSKLVCELWGLDASSVDVVEHSVEVNNINPPDRYKGTKFFTLIEPVNLTAYVYLNVGIGF